MKWHLSVVTKLGLLITAVFTLFFLAMFIVVWNNEEKNILQVMLKQSRALSQQILITRNWASEYEGVYVYKRTGDITNPYLYQVAPGKIRPEITDNEGHLLTLKNPSLITRELSERTGRKGLISYRLTSLKPINPENKPDSFDLTALKHFAAGNKEMYESAKEHGETIFHYAVPLFVEESCLLCHGNQGYRVGDIRGVLSLRIPMASELALMNEKKQGALVLGLAALFLMMLALGIGSHSLIVRPVRVMSDFADKGFHNGGKLPELLIARKDEVGALAGALQESAVEISAYRESLENLVAKRTEELEDARKQLDELSRTDPLTGLNNRRHLQLEARKILDLSLRQNMPVAFLMIDIDHFKDFNDNYGHEAGDRALVHTAILLRKSLRSYDLLIRYGGEEFLLILPFTDQRESVSVAERIRSDVEQTPVMLQNREVPIKVSVGLYISGEINDINETIGKADEALYRAKRAGRNRVCVGAVTELGGDVYDI